MLNEKVLAIALALAALAVVGAVVVLWVRSRKSQKRRIAFQEAQSRDYSYYEKAYQASRAKLGEHWDVIEVIHDLSPYSLGPAGLPEEITFEQAFEIVRQIRAAKDDAIAMVLHTNGGFSMPTDMIAKALWQHKGKKVAFVPYTAMSGGTVIALAADHVEMGLAAALGPIDTQYWGWPASAFEYLKQTKSPDRIDDHHVMMMHVAEKFEKDAVTRASKRINANHRPTVAAALTSGVRYHGDTISAQEAREIGINVATKECPKDIYALVDAKLGMLAKERQQIFRRGLDLKNEQPADIAQQCHTSNRF
jgi:ClpP class serine protease